MTIEDSFNNFYEVAKQTATDAINGDCGRNWKQMKDKQIDTIVKVALIAVAAGIVCGLICGTGGLASGLVSGVFFAGVIGISALAYFTNNEHCNLYEQVKDEIKTGARIAQKEAQSKKNEIISEWNSFMEKIFG
ncbi:MAG: hypothetical protein H0T62_14795 [Parachlamydiaceae bacterium]|nr:hypothetical protein [Parachlamydiaceae bacterium]